MKWNRLFFWKELDEWTQEALIIILMNEPHMIDD
jgi:hypothetical protein